MNVRTEDRPYVLNEDRLEIKEVGQKFYHVKVHYGFMQTPNVPRIIEMCRFHGINLTWEETTFFFGRETLIATDRVGMAKWRESLFIFLSRNAQTAMEFFRIPPNKVIELGIQVEL
jgi:KUP system potassium uptake protein